MREQWESREAAIYDGRAAMGILCLLLHDVRRGLAIEWWTTLYPCWMGTARALQKEGQLSVGE